MCTSVDGATCPPAEAQQSHREWISGGHTAENWLTFDVNANSHVCPLNLETSGEMQTAQVM